MAGRKTITLSDAWTRGSVRPRFGEPLEWAQFWAELANADALATLPTGRFGALRRQYNALRGLPGSSTPVELESAHRVARWGVWSLIEGMRFSPSRIEPRAWPYWEVRGDRFVVGVEPYGGAQIGSTSYPELNFCRFLTAAPYAFFSRCPQCSQAFARRGRAKFCSKGCKVAVELERRRNDPQYRADQAERMRTRREDARRKRKAKGKRHRSIATRGKGK